MSQFEWTTEDADWMDLRKSDLCRSVESELSVVNPLQFWHGWREFPCLNLGLKSHARVAAVAEGLVCRVPAAAKRDYRSPRKSERVTRNVFDYNVAADDPKRAIVVDCYRLIVLVAHQLPPIPFDLDR
jgi:hypothetical protein